MTVTVGIGALSIEDVVAVAREGAAVELAAEALALQGLRGCESTKSDDWNMLGKFFGVGQILVADFTDRQGVKTQYRFRCRDVDQNKGARDIFLLLLAGHGGQPFIQLRCAAIEPFAVMG